MTQHPPNYSPERVRFVVINQRERCCSPFAHATASGIASHERVEMTGNKIDPATGEIVEVALDGEWGTKGTQAQMASLFDALARAQSAIGAAKKGATNPHLQNKYADLASYIEASSEALEKNGLSVVQLPLKARVVTVLGHKDGGMIHGSTPIILGEGKGLNPAQVYGSACSYARRYGRGAILDMAAEDDDAAGAGAAKGSESKAGASAKGSTATPPPAKPAKAAAPAPTGQPAPNQRAPVTDASHPAAVKEIRAMLAKAKREEVSLCAYLGCESLEKATNAQLDKALAALDAPKKVATAQVNAAAAPANTGTASGPTAAAPQAQNQASLLPPASAVDEGPLASIKSVREKLKTANRDEAALCGWLGCESLEKATGPQLDKALAALEPKQRAA